MRLSSDSRVGTWVKFFNDSLSKHETLRRLQRDWQQPFRDLSVRDPVKLFEAEAFQDLL